ncbi:glycosylated lysosomal membrane protein B-like [Protopterus annectens]|uniref:glycosylated lysosomal membrane protein B-like n=1 Tax=Protopterus annectens TaxID=7888 RepID=UPI001CFA7756|nr:glycosylated lysosomal membrane protein B-like [Protopterus annectens]
MAFGDEFVRLKYPWVLFLVLVVFLRSGDCYSHKVFEYDDVKNTANVTMADKIFPPYNLADFTWEDVNATLNHTTLTAEFNGHNVSAAGLFKNGSISFKVSAFETTGRDAVLPRLLHNANSSKMEFVVDRVVPRGNYSRFMLEMVIVEKKANHRVMKSIHSIDDEYTPSIFEMTELVAVPQNSSAIHSFVQWKVVAYQSSKYQHDDSIPCADHELQVINQTFPSNSIAGAYFSETLDNCNIASINISFGIAEGDYYKDHNFLSWSIMIGCGNPLEDTFSILVICIMAVGLGTPVLLLILGCVVVKYSDYGPIN